MDADDVETELLALRAQLRELDGRVSALDEPIEQINQMVADLVDEKRAAGPDPFSWPDLEPDTAQERWDDLLTWIRDVLVPRCPRPTKQLRACWWQHPDAVDALTASWLLWAQIFRGKADAKDAAEWHRTQIPALTEQLKAAMASCGRQHEDDQPPTDVLSSVPLTL